MLAPALTYFRTHRLPDLFFREVGFNETPKILIARTGAEVTDELISQYGSSFPFVLIGLGMDGLMGRKTLQGLLSRLKPASAKNAIRWFRLGKSFSIFAMVFGTIFSAAFIRNTITTKRIGTRNYAQMIGEKKRTTQSEAETKRQLDGYKKTILKSIGGGALAATLIFGSALWAMKTGAAMPKALQFLQKHVGLKRGKFIHFNEWALLFAWAIPSYGGYFAGATDKYEVKELLLKFAAFLLGFYIFPRYVEKGIERLVKGMKPTKFFGPPENLAYFGKSVTALIGLGATPPVLNIFLTRRRIANDAKKQQRVQAGTLPEPLLKRPPGPYRPPFLRAHPTPEPS